MPSDGAISRLGSRDVPSRIPASAPSKNHRVRVCFYLDRARVLGWHAWLAEALAAEPGYALSVTFAPQCRPLPKSCSLLFDLEHLIFREVRPTAVAPAESMLRLVGDGSASDTTSADVVIDFAGDGSSLPRAARILRPVFDGIAGEVGLLAALVEKKLPLVEVLDSSRPGTPWTARPALADRDVLSRSVENMLSCAARLLLQALQEPASALAAADTHPWRTMRPRALGPGTAAAHALGALTHKIGRLLGMLARGGESWAVAWRAAGAHSLCAVGRAAFSVKPDDGRRYYADPFPFRFGGRNFVFVEEFPYATGRGCISVFDIDANGVAGEPRPVIEEAFHLSYPFVFELDGVVWMIPEAGESGGIYLYRAEHFPFKWRREGCLIDGIAAYDATLMPEDGRLWLFVCERAWGSSGWDILTLFHADRLMGNWLPHAGNPVLIDARFSRPAGAVLRHNGERLRPVQDCSRLYGGAVPLCRIDALAPDAFRQSVVGRIHGGDLGCHTYNLRGGIEVIDAFGRVRGSTGIAAFFAPEEAPS